MKVFLGTLGVLAAIALGWNYWVMHRAATPANGPGRFTSPGFARGGSSRGGPFRPTSEVTGAVRMAGGVSHSAHVDLVRVAPEGSNFRVIASEEALGDGRFTFTRIPADRYWAVARTELDADPMRPGEGPTQVFYGLAEVATDGEHPGHAGIQLHPASVLTGQVTAEPALVLAPKDFTTLTISLKPADAQARAVTAAGDVSALLAADGRFTIGDVPPGRFTLDVSPPSWNIDAIEVADHDRLDRPFQVGTGERLTARVTLTEHANQIGGTLRDGNGRARPFALVSVFSVDASQREAHRRVQLVRSDSKGIFRFEGLPSGDYLLASADGFDPTTWRTTEFFEHLTPKGVRVSVGHGKVVTRDLSLTSR